MGLYSDLDVGVCCVVGLGVRKWVPQTFKNDRWPISCPPSPSTLSAPWWHLKTSLEEASVPGEPCCQLLPNEHLLDSRLR